MIEELHGTDQVTVKRVLPAEQRWIMIHDENEVRILSGPSPGRTIGTPTTMTVLAADTKAELVNEARRLNLVLPDRVILRDEPTPQV